MIIILEPNCDLKSEAASFTINYLSKLANIEAQVQQQQAGSSHVTEIHLIGDTGILNDDEILNLPLVKEIVHINPNRSTLRATSSEDHSFDYNGVSFSQNNFHLFPGLCAVDTKKNVEQIMRTLKHHDINCTRMGAYKPRTSPYSFQGHGAACLPYVFELAGKYDIKVIAMEVTHENQIHDIETALATAGNPTGVMLQIGTRNAQNFELLKAVGKQQQFPVLLKRGFGITLKESLSAAEYVATGGNKNIVFCLRGVKTSLGNPHRNLADFSLIPVVKRETIMPVCIDPSHAIGSLDTGTDHISDIMHAAASGIIAGANMMLLDIHPDPKTALVDGKQALTLKQLSWVLDDIALVRECYAKRRQLAGG